MLVDLGSRGTYRPPASSTAGWVTCALIWNAHIVAESTSCDRTNSVFTRKHRLVYSR